MGQSASQEPPSAEPATGLRAGTFALGTFESEGWKFPALVHADGAVVDLSDRFSDLHQVFAEWDTNFEVLDDLSGKRSRATMRIEGLRALPPLSHPQLLCAGANNKTHVAQMLTKNDFNQHNRHPGESDAELYQRIYESMDARSREGTPFFWIGVHSALTGATGDVVLPPLGKQHDWELELGVVIGRSERCVTPDEAQQMIAGYTIINDLGSVDIFRRTDVPFGYDWISKQQPTFKPCGPFIVPAQFLDIDESVRIRLSVNGKVMQDWPVNDWIFSPADYITYASERLRLLPGDIIAMGSPPGNGAHHGGRFLCPGDLIESEITYLGRQRNPCVAEETQGRSLHFGLWENK